ncbi:uncharacterized protein [Prorops nasuta]|uniref:uncharacterized protein n=1 Tax=Prorops nasuta TaxID=863751 RepID=UPI0034CF34D7
MRFTKAEYVDMVFAYGAAQESACKAAKLYREKFPLRRHPHHTVILRVIKNFKSSGSVAFPKRKVNINQEREERVLRRIRENPLTSVRQLSRLTNTSAMTAHRILRRNRFHPFHFQRVHQLLPRDYQPRVNFCEGFLAQCRRDETFPDKILWSDESTFTPNGIFNSKNFVFWSQENPHAVRVGAFQQRWTINVWAGLIGDQIIGPFFLPPRLDGEKYASFLEEQLPLLLEDVPLIVRKNLIFQHDGAPAHFHISASIKLHERFPDRWMGRGGPIAWPPRSPDLNPLDYFLWGHPSGNFLPAWYRFLVLNTDSVQIAITG